MGTKNNPAPFDCYANAAPDEPMFVLLGRDRHAEVLVRLWAILRAHDDKTEDEDKITEAMVCADSMQAWADSLSKRRLNGAHPVLGFDPGATSKSDTVIEKIFLAATEGLNEHPDGFDQSCQCALCLSYGC